jgi:subtilisin family serine protease
MILVQEATREPIPDARVTARSVDGDRELRLTFDERLARYTGTVEPGRYEITVQTDHGEDKRLVDVDPDAGNVLVVSTFGSADSLSYRTAQGDRVFFEPAEDELLVYAYGRSTSASTDLDVGRSVGADEVLSSLVQQAGLEAEAVPLPTPGEETGDDEPDTDLGMPGEPGEADEAVYLVHLPDDEDARTDAVASVEMLVDDQLPALGLQSRTARPMRFEAEDARMQGLTNELVVRFDEDVDRDRVEDLADDHGCEVLRSVAYAGNTYVLRRPGLPDYDLLELVAELESEPEVEHAEPEVVYQAEPDQYVPDDFLYAEQPHFDVAEVEEGWDELDDVDHDLRFGSPDVAIAVVDTGTDPGHPDLTGPLSDGSEKLVRSYDFINMADATAGGLGSDHGTKSSSSACARTDNGTGVAGVAGNCRLIGIRRPSNLTGQQMADAWLWAGGLDALIDTSTYTTFPDPLDQPADVITNSWGVGNAPLSMIIQGALDALTDQGRDGNGCVVLFSTGNLGYMQFAPIRTWAAYNRTIAVGASINANPTNPCTSSQPAPNGETQNLPAVVDTRTYYCPWGPELDLVAPSHTSYAVGGGIVDPVMSGVITGGGDWPGAATSSTTLTAVSSSGDVDLDVAGTGGFSVGDAVLVGTPGGANAEVTTVTSVDVSSLGVNALANDHPAGTAVVTGPADYAIAFGGTSHACPTVAGAAALLLSLRPELTWQEVRDILRDSADPIDTGQTNAQGQWQDTDGDGVDDFSDWYGNGRLNVGQAIADAKADALTVDLLTPSVVFNDVPEGVTTVRAAVFSVRSFAPVSLEVTDAPDAPFALHAGATVTVPSTGGVTTEARVWFTYTAGSAGSTASDTVDIHCPQTGETWTDIPITANAIVRPTSAVELVLDRSGSMNDPSGVTTAGGVGLTRMEVLKYSAPPLVELLTPDDAVGVVRFNEDASVGTGITAAGAPLVGVGRVQANAAISGTSPGGYTSIGDGVVLGQSELDGVSGYDNEAIVVLTDGKENRLEYIADVIDTISAEVYAIGLGTPEQLNPAALDALVSGTGGYLLMTGDLASTDYYRLAKYYLQVLAGVSAADVVLDPEGHLRPGAKHRIPFEVTDAEYETDVVLLRPRGSSFDFVLETPDGDVVDPSTAGGTPGMSYVAADDVAYYRLSLPAAVGDGAHEGTWHAVLTMDDSEFREYLQYVERTDPSGFGVVETHGVRYSLAVHARSNLRLHASIAQDSLEPGATLTVRARLREYEHLPVSGQAAVFADLEEPDGATHTLSLDEVSPGVFEATHVAHLSGVYPVRVRVEGTTASGRRFTREHLLTGLTYRGGDDPLPTGRDHGEPAPTGPDSRLCEFLRCLTEEAFAEYFEERGVDVRALRKCLERYCEGVEDVDDGRDRAPGGERFARRLDPRVVETLVRDPRVVEAFSVISDAMESDDTPSGR